MKDYTPHKDHTRTSEVGNRKAKKAQNITKKNLVAAFSSVSSDVPKESSKESMISSPVSEITEVDHSDAIENFKSLPDPAFSSTSEALVSFDHVLSSDVAVEKGEQVTVSSSNCRFSGDNDLKCGSLEAEIAVNFLKCARSQIFNSADVNFQSKKVLDALVEIVLEELPAIPEEKDQLVDILSAKSSILIVFLVLFLWIFIAALILFFSSSDVNSFPQALPT